MSNQKKALSIKTVVGTGIGAAVFFVLARFVSIPTPVPNTSITLQYAVLSLFAVLFGPVAGALIALIGHALSDLTAYGSPWWSWIIASTFVGAALGFLKYRIHLDEGEFGWKEVLTFNVAQLIANALAWLVIAPTLDILIYAEPANKVYLQGAVAGAFDFLTVAVIGTLLLLAYSKTRTRQGSLTKEQ